MKADTTTSYFTPAQREILHQAARMLEAELPDMRKASVLARARQGRTPFRLFNADEEYHDSVQALVTLRRLVPPADRFHGYAWSDHNLHSYKSFAEEVAAVEASGEYELMPAYELVPHFATPQANMDLFLSAAGGNGEVRPFMNRDGRLVNEYAYPIYRRKEQPA